MRILSIVSSYFPRNAFLTYVLEPVSEAQRSNSHGNRPPSSGLQSRELTRRPARMSQRSQTSRQHGEVPRLGLHNAENGRETAEVVGSHRALFMAQAFMVAGLAGSEMVRPKPKGPRELPRTRPRCKLQLLSASTTSFEIRQYLSPWYRKAHQSPQDVR